MQYASPALPRPGALVAADARHVTLPDGTPTEVLRAGSVRALVAFACHYRARRAWPAGTPLLPPAQQAQQRRAPPVDADFCDSFLRAFPCFSSAAEVGAEVEALAADAVDRAAAAREAAAAAAAGGASSAATAAATAASGLAGLASGAALGASELAAMWLDPAADFLPLLSAHARADALAAGARLHARLRAGAVGAAFPPSAAAAAGAGDAAAAATPSALEGAYATLAQQGPAWPALAASVELLGTRLAGAARLVDALGAVSFSGGAGGTGGEGAFVAAGAPQSLLAARAVQTALGFRYAPLPPHPWLGTAPQPALPASPLPLLALPAQTLAEQWTLLDHAAFARIPLQEFLECGWDRARYEHCADAVRAYVDRFNAVALWVSAEVLAQPGDEERAAVITRFAQVASHFRRLNNFCGVSAVGMALRRESVARLRFAWDLVPRAAAARLAELAQMITDREQYRRYKEALRAATTGERAAETPAVPHLGAHTMELTAAEMNLPLTTELGRAAAAGAKGPPVGVNFKRFRTLLAMAEPLVALQGRCYLQAGVVRAALPAVQGALQTALRPFFFVVDEDREAAVARLEARSFRIEPEESAEPVRPAPTPQKPAATQQQQQQQPPRQQELLALQQMQAQMTPAQFQQMMGLSPAQAQQGRPAGLNPARGL